MLVGLAFCIAASANLPALLFALFWPRFNTTGAVLGVLGGLTASLVLIILSPAVWPGPDSEGSPLGSLGLANPALFSIPIGFAVLLARHHPEQRAGRRSASTTSSTCGRRPAWAPRRRSPCTRRIRRWPSGAHRTELTPLDVPRAQRGGARRAHRGGARRAALRLRRARRRAANRLASALLRAGARAARPGGGAVPEHAGPARGALRRAAGRRGARGHEHPPERRRGRLHPARLAARASLLVDARAARAPVERSDLDGLETVDGARHAARTTTPTSSFLASGSPEPARVLARGRGGADLHQLHLGHDRAAQGRRLHPSRRVPARATASRSRRCMGYDTVHLWTLPMFHCNGWCLTRGRSPRSPARTCACARSSPRGSGSCLEEEGVTHYSGAPTIHINIVNHERAHRLEQRVTVPTGGSPPTPTLLAQMRELNLHPRHLYGLTESLRAATGCTWHPPWDEPRSRGAGAHRWPARATRTTGADRVRVVDDDMDDVPRDGETLGEVVHARQQRHGPLPRHAGRDRGGVPRRLVPLRRPRRLAPRRPCRPARPRQGHHHLRRGEHLDIEVESGPLQPSGGARGGGRGDARRDAGASGRRRSWSSAQARRPARTS